MIAHPALRFAAVRRPLDLAALRQGNAPGTAGINPIRPGLLRNGNRGGDPSRAPRCQARCRHDHRPCRQPAMRGRRVCRMHGGKAGAPRGRRHGNFRHGFHTAETQALLALARRRGRALKAAIRRAKLWLAMRPGEHTVAVMRHARPGDVEVLVRQTWRGRPRLGAARHDAVPEARCGIISP